MAKKTYIGVSVIPNPPPISSTSGWLPNQNTTVSVSYSALRVVSNQNTSTPGVYTDLTSAIPSGTYVTLTYTMRGNVRVCASVWNNSSSGVLNTEYYQLTDAFQTYSISGTLSSVVNRLYFFMTNPTTSSWFEVGEIQLSYGVAKAVKKMYIGIGGVARKVKKVYMGVNGVAKMIYQACVHTYNSVVTQPTCIAQGYTTHTCTQCGDSHIDSYTAPNDNHAYVMLTNSEECSRCGFVKRRFGVASAGQATNLSSQRSGMSTTTVGNYALFGGGANNRASTPTAVDTVDAYDSSLTKSTPTALSQARYSIGATTVGSYALFGGGYASSFVKTVDAYNTSLTRSTPTQLLRARRDIAATSVGGYALFGGGYMITVAPDVDVYNASLTHSLASDFSQARFESGATTIGNYALFAGGRHSSGSGSQYYTATGDAYNSSLTRSSLTGLSYARSPIAASVGGYALFAGGSNYDTRYATVDVYNTSLTRSLATELKYKPSQFAATTVGNYALFGGGIGYTNDGTYARFGNIDMYNASLTKQDTLALSDAKYDLSATSVGRYALFGGGRTGSTSSALLATVDAYINYEI